MEEDRLCLQLLVGPGNIFSISQKILLACQNGNWEVEKAHIIVRWGLLAIFCNISIITAHVVSSECFLRKIDKLGVVKKVLVTCARWKIRHIDIISLSVVNSRILVCKKTHE